MPQEEDATAGQTVTDAMGALVHFLVEHTKPRVFSGLAPAIQELWLSALRVLPPADSVRPAVVLEGYLSKRGKSLRLWQRRFYIVRYSSIFYYKNEKQASYSLADEPRGIIDLSAVSVIQVCAHDACKMCVSLVYVSRARATVHLSLSASVSRESCSRGFLQFLFFYTACWS